MTNIWIGLISGFLATAVLSMFMLAKSAMGVMPQLNMIIMLWRVTDQPKSVDWLIHFVVGTVLYGILFALLWPLLPGGWLLKGIILGLVAEVIGGVTLLPAAGKGLFGANLGAKGVMMPVMMHQMFGIAFAIFYSWLG